MELMDGSDGARNIAIDMVSLRAMIDHEDVFDDWVLGTFGSAEVDGLMAADDDKRYIGEEIKKVSR